ncbi:hypothetical protein DPMN_052103 [Dreissena polymorpha]|uniref:Ig-like domain-containing protein n=1 Tax=Dreissena polymorpha TaxID=45954 RepID=A0A9D4CL34_DREPO|nr:hypothetical protein DPMN_052103 [Dreissena polymorpha]
MALPYCIHVCTIFLVMIYSADSCMEQYSATGDENVQLFFFNFNSNDGKITCHNEKTIIGDCNVLFGMITCSLKPSISGVYEIIPNEDLTSLNISIRSFNEDMAGEYSCFKNGIQSSTSICIKTVVNLTSLVLLPQTDVSYPVYKEQSEFKCTTSPSRPSARIHWFAAGRNMTDMAIYTQSSEGATSILRYTPQAITSEDLICTAYYVFKSTNITIQRRTYMTIQYPVSRSIISINNSNVSETALIREGRSAEFKCYASSYPPPRYRWFYPGGTSEVATVTIQFNHTATGGKMSCNATNNYYSLNGTAGTKSTTLDRIINLNITFPPLFVSIKNIENNTTMAENIIRLVKGDSLRLICESVANPPATTLWQVKHVNSNIMTAIIIQEDTQWTCVAFNTIDGVPERTNRTIYFEVLYGPVHLNLTYNIFPGQSKNGIVLNDGNITVIEGSAVLLKCSDSSLPHSKYFWDDGLEGRIRNISNISRTTKTSFTCMAKNIMTTTFNGNVTGRNNISLHLHVLYGPRDMSVLFNNMLVISRVLRVLEGWSFGLSCIANSLPASDISWKGITTQEGGNYIFISNVSIGINKIVTCTGTNTMVDSLGHSISKSENLTIELDVLYPPIVQPIDKQYVVINMSLNVVCKLATFGNPPETNFTWTKLDSNRTFLNTGVILKIDRVQLSDEGDYQCQATNTMHAIGNTTVQGSSKSKFYLDIQCSPIASPFAPPVTTLHRAHNDTAVLTFTIKAYPEPSVINLTWFKGVSDGWDILSYDY